MPCPAGFRPVRNDDHAVGVTAGMVERSGPYAPSRARRASVGRRPSASSTVDQVVVGAVEAEARAPSWRRFYRRAGPPPAGTMPAMSTAKKLMIVGLDCVPPEIVFDDMRDELPVLSGLMERGAWGRLESCDPPITVPAWSCMMSSKDPGTLGLLRLPQPQGPLLRRARLRDVRQGARRPAVGHARARGQARRRSGRAADVPAAAGERRDGELLPDAVAPTRSYTYPEELKDEMRRGRRRLHGRRPRLPHRREGPHPARHQRDDAAPVRARAPPARHAAVGLLHAGRDGARPPAPRASGASTTTTTPTTSPATRTRQAFRDYYRYLDGEVGALIEGLDDDDRRPRRLRPRRAGHARRHPGQRVARCRRAT